MLNIQFRIHYTMLVVVYADLGQTLETHDELHMWDHKNSLDEGVEHYTLQE